MTISDSDYPFRIVRREHDKASGDKTKLARRPFLRFDQSLEMGAKRYVVGEDMETAINTAIAVGAPLLLTGEPGTGKTQSAYWVANELEIQPVIHFQVKSDTSAQDLLYNFDAVRYFHDANTSGDGPLNKADYIEKRPLWEALESPVPRVLLIDEIDKAPRDFPNDLLHELDQMSFVVKETGRKVSGDPAKRPIVFITSNSERRLPEPFLRRCVYHHIRFDDQVLRNVIEMRRAEFSSLSPEFIELALKRFLSIRELKNLRKLPTTGEFLVWVRVLALTIGSEPEALMGDLADLPYLATLIKDSKDLESVEALTGDDEEFGM